MWCPFLLKPRLIALVTLLVFGHLAALAFPLSPGADGSSTLTGVAVTNEVELRLPLADIFKRDSVSSALQIKVLTSRAIAKTSSYDTSRTNVAAIAMGIVGSIIGLVITFIAISRCRKDRASREGSVASEPPVNYAVQMPNPPQHRPMHPHAYNNWQNAYNRPLPAHTRPLSHVVRGNRGSSSQQTLTPQDFKRLSHQQFDAFYVSNFVETSLAGQPLDTEKQLELHECSICLEPFELSQTITRLPCIHAFHKTCIENWLLKQCNFCPICRNQVSDSLNQQLR